MKMTPKRIIYLFVIFVFLVSCASVAYETREQTGYGLSEVMISYEYPSDARWEGLGGIIRLQNSDPVEFRSLDLKLYEDLSGLQLSLDDIESIMEVWISIRSHNCQELIDSKSLETKYGLRGEMAVSYCEGSDNIFITALLTDEENIISIVSFSSENDYKETQRVFEYMIDSLKILPGGV